MESPSKRARLSRGLNGDFTSEDESSEILESEGAGSDSSTSAPFSTCSDSEAEPRVESQAEQSGEDEVYEDWWAAGPEGPLRFLMLLEEPLLSNYLIWCCLTCGDRLPSGGWVLDTGPLLEVAFSFGG